MQAGRAFSYLDVALTDALEENITVGMAAGWLVPRPNEKVPSS